MPNYFETFRETLKNDAAYATLIDNKGLLLEQQGSAQEAKQHFDEAECFLPRGIDDNEFPRLRQYKLELYVGIGERRSSLDHHEELRSTVGLFRKKRQSISLSALFADTLSFVFKETNGKFVEIYLPSVGFELGENIAQNWEAYISLLAKFFYADLLNGRRFRIVGTDSMDFEAAWRSGLELALRRHCNRRGSFPEKLSKCLAAVDDYSAAYEGHRAEHLGPPADRYFSACQHFVDLVVGELTWENTQAHTDVFTLRRICLNWFKQRASPRKRHSS